MEVNRFLQWHYLIYLLPGGISALLLLLTTFKPGHRGGHAGHHGHGGHVHSVGHSAHAPANISSGATAHGHAGTGTGGIRPQATTTHAGSQPHRAVAQPAKPNTKSDVRSKPRSDSRSDSKATDVKDVNLLAQLTGADRAPASLLIEAFCLIWAVSGYIANEYTLHVAHPNPGQILPSLFIALVIGVVGTRLTAEMAARFLPEDETQAVSQQSLFGRTGKVVFRVSETSGRIHIYDEHGTLHDEMCRLASGQAGVPIEKGHTAMVLDIDSAGNLLVEEVTEPIRG